MKVIITGGCGFIGSHVAEAFLADGHEIIIIDNLSTGRKENVAQVADQVKIVEADISVPGEWVNHFKNADWVIHLAALAEIVPSIQRPADYFHSNVDGTFNVLEASRLNNIKRFVYTASSSCYGISEIYPTPETAPINPEYPYALTKYLGEQLVLHWAKVYKLGALSLRLFNVYGPRSRTSGTYGAMFGVFLAQKLANQPFTIVGKGEQTRDFTFVKDVARAFLTAVKSNKAGEVYNVGSGKTISVNRIVELLGGEKVYIPKRPGEPDCTFGDISKINQDLHWEPQVAIEEGVNELIKNIDYWKNAPVWNPESIAKETKDWFKYLGN